MPSAEKGDPWVAPTNISLRRGEACLAPFQHAAGGEGRPMGRPHQYLSSEGRGMPRAVSACRRWMKGDPWVAPTNISLRMGEACRALFQHAGGGRRATHGSPLRISLFVGARHASPSFSTPAVDEGRPMGRPYEYLSL